MVRVVDDDEIQALITKLARRHRSGGVVIERAAILAEGADFGAVVAWITAHDGTPEVAAPPAASRGLHASRMERDDSRSQTPLRFVIPASALA